VVALQLLPSWLALDRGARRAKAEPMQAIAARHQSRVSFDWFDADALGNGFSDWVLCRFDDLDHYHALWEEIRDTEVFAHPYAEITQVMLGLADGYQRFEAGEL
jgi:hypothetical protein